LANFRRECVNLQIGHSPKGVDEKHYMDPRMVDASPSSKAVWEVLTGQRLLTGETVEKPIALPLQLAAGAEGMVTIVVSEEKTQPTAPEKTLRASSQVVKAARDEFGAGEGVRTLDFDLGNPLRLTA
jgi:hypothetical protein